MQIVEYVNDQDFDVKFLDNHGYIKRHTTYSNFKKGQIKNLYDKTICEIGYLGDGCYKTKIRDNIHTQEYRIWVAMIRRCYDGKRANIYPAYYGKCIVCDDWHNYQIFAKWYSENFYIIDERLHIDKDILFPQSKTYSPETCLLVPQRINELFTYRKNNDGVPIGITKTKAGKFSAEYNTQTLGTFSTLTEAFEAYKTIKEKTIKKVAEEYKNIIPGKLYDALIEYEVLIENDINYTVPNLC